jgi:hypothetical protein
MLGDAESIDLSLEGRSDDLVSLGRDLWAEGEGFDRIEPALADDRITGRTGRLRTSPPLLSRARPRRRR